MDVSTSFASHKLCDSAFRAGCCKKQTTGENPVILREVAQGIWRLSMDSRAVVLDWGDFAPKETFGKVWRHFRLSQVGRMCCWQPVNRNQDAARHSACRTAPVVNSAKAEKPCSRESQATWILLTAPPLQNLANPHTFLWLSFPIWKMGLILVSLSLS